MHTFPEHRFSRGTFLSVCSYIGPALNSLKGQERTQDVRLVR